tara:strand:- start:132 stop:464 length:333 start_codon:yes stop_codon:yes gene_type:complete
MKFTALLIAAVAGAKVRDGQVCNTIDGCLKETSKCCYSTATEDAGKVYNGLYCVTPTQTTIMSNEQRLTVGKCPPRTFPPAPTPPPAATGAMTNKVGLVASASLVAHLSL